MSRTRRYSFVLDDKGASVELGSGRFAKAYLGEESWLESKTAFRRPVAIKVLQSGVSAEDALRFQMEKELLERVQGHPNVIRLYASGEAEDPNFIPPSLRSKLQNDFLVLELCDISLEEHLKGTRNREKREDLLQYSLRERLFRVLEYMLPIASAIEYAHLVRNVTHRDIKPANVLLKKPDPRLKGAILEVRLADFNVGKGHEDGVDLSLTQVQGVPGTQFFQAPEQENNAFELLVNTQKGSREIEYFDEFFIQIAENDTFQLYNRNRRYLIVGCDRNRKKLTLSEPYAEHAELNVRAKITKSVDRPADVYSLGALFYYLISGAYGNPKTLHDAFHKFIEYDGDLTQNTIHAYLEHEYSVIQNLRAPKVEGDGPMVSPADRFFSYKHYLDGNGELIDREIIEVIARAMIRNKPDSYCQSWDVSTTGVSDFVEDLKSIYGSFGAHLPTRPGYVLTPPPLKGQGGFTGFLKKAKFWSRPPKAPASQSALPPPPEIPAAPEIPTAKSPSVAPPPSDKPDRDAQKKAPGSEASGTGKDEKKKA